MKNGAFTLLLALSLPLYAQWKDTVAYIQGLIERDLKVAVLFIDMQ